MSWLKIYISWVGKPLKKYTFFTSLDEINVIFVPKIKYPLYNYKILWVTNHSNTLMTNATRLNKIIEQTSTRLNNTVQSFYNTPHYSADLDII